MSGFDIAIVDLTTIIVQPGCKLRVILEDKDGKEHTLTNIATPLLAVQDDGSEGPGPGMPWIVQLGYDIEAHVGRRMKENRVRYVYKGDGKIELRVEPVIPRRKGE